MPASADFRFPATRPELPPLEEWRPLIEEAYAANWFTNFGALSRRLEAVLADAWSAEGSICVVASSGTVALAAPLIAQRIKGDVIIPAFTFPATLSAVLMAGLRPVLVDVAPDTWIPSPGALASALRQSSAKAVILVCPFGLRRDISAQLEVARAHGATFIIDNAAGLGAARSRVEPARNVFEVFSMHATKPFGIGEGGAIFTHSENEERLRCAMNFGLPTLGAGEAPKWGVNGKMSEFQAAIGLAVARSFETRVAARRELVARYIDSLAHVEAIRSERAPDQACWQVFPVLMPSEAAAVAAVDLAREQGMEIRRYYRPALSSIDWLGAVKCPVSEDLAARMICLPVYSRLTAAESARMVEVAAHSLQSAVRRRH